MRWNDQSFEWEGETPDGLPIAVAGEAFMDAVAEYLRSVYGDAATGYSDAQVREANAVFHAPGSWFPGMPGVRLRGLPESPRGAPPQSY
jgi:hypothetical protein